MKVFISTSHELSWLSCQLIFPYPWIRWEMFFTNHLMAKNLVLPKCTHSITWTKERGSQKERESAHTLPSLSAFAAVWTGAAAAHENSSKDRQHVILRTAEYTACFLLVSSTHSQHTSTFIHYRPLYLHVASHWLNSNVSVWRQVNPPFGFQCSKDWGK